MRGHVIGRLKESFYNEVRRKVNFPRWVESLLRQAPKNLITQPATSQVGKAGPVPAQVRCHLGVYCCIRASISLIGKT